MDERQQATEILSESECWELLDHAAVGRLAVDIAGQPDIFPINFVVDKSGIVFRSAAGTKLAGAVLNRVVAFEIDGYEPAESTAWSVVVNGDPSVVADEYRPVPMTLAAGLLRSLESGQSWRLAQFAGCTVNAVAGIGNPKRFFDLLRHARITVREYPFPDHHQFSLSDFESMDVNLPVLMTEKDAVKIKNLGLKNAWSLAVEAVLPPQWESEVVSRLMKEKA